MAIQNTFSIFSSFFHMQTTWVRGRDKPPSAWNGTPSQVDHPRQPPVTTEPYRSPHQLGQCGRRKKCDEICCKQTEAAFGYLFLWEVPLWLEAAPASQSAWRAVFKLNNIITINSVEIIVIIIIPEMMFRKQRLKSLIVRRELLFCWEWFSNIII